MKKNIHIFTYLTPSHKGLYEEYFLPSLKGVMKKDRKVSFTPVIGNQISKTGDFVSPGLKETMLDKTKKLMEFCIDLEVNDIVLSTDVDLMFIKPDIFNVIRDGLEFHELIAQDEGKERICPGFMAFNLSHATLWMIKDLIKYTPIYKHDQDALNKIKNHYFHTLFKSTDVYSPYHAVGKVWKLGMPMYIPNDIMVFHANWTIGLENKKLLLEDANKILNPVMKY